jgi:tetratricopeptide (TPR) repeat protein
MPNRPFPALIPLVGRLVLISAFLLPLGSDPARAEENSGAYLAARVAESNNDFRAAAAWYGRALLKDGSNPRLLDGAILAEMGVGDFALAAKAATTLKGLGEKSELAEFALIAEEAKREDYAALLKAGKEGRDLGPLVNDLVMAWAALGEGRMSDAVAGFDALTKTKGLEAFGYYHKALALASAGDFEGADEILSGRAAGPIFVMRRGVFAHVQILSQLERNADALALLDRSFGTDPDPMVDATRARLKAGEPIPFDTVKTARDGLAEAFFSVSTALNGDADPVYTLIHTRIATYLRPDHTDAVLLTADVLGSLGQPQLAVETFALIAPEDPAFVSAEIGRAEALQAQDKTDAALEALRALARSNSELIYVQTALGDLLRSEERFDEAVKVYDVAIGLIEGKVTEDHWALFFSRGICHEQLKDWGNAEADFREALALNPNQPQVLNYLGYGLVDRGEKLDEALKMIQRAVAADPQKGYIIDSLAWAFFRLGRYEEALAPMEKASVLEPVDPVVTDHLGDVYWAVGRKLEARFQWQRALSFEPTEKDAERIRRKLEIGLDAVMAEEGAAPAKVEAVENEN